MDILLSTNCNTGGHVYFPPLDFSRFTESDNDVYDHSDSNQICTVLIEQESRQVLSDINFLEDFIS